MKIVLRKMGNSQGVIIPKTVIAELELEYDMSRLIIFSVPDDSFKKEAPPQKSVRINVFCDAASKGCTSTHKLSAGWPSHVGKARLNLALPLRYYVDVLNTASGGVFASFCRKPRGRIPS